jgi:DNA-binding NarL/FixJ family response regulator
MLADDTLIAREGWRAIIETTEDISVVGEATVVEEVCPAACNLRPDLVLLDLKWGADKRIGLRTISRLKSLVPDAGVIAISAYEELLAQARQAGADGALSKSFSRRELLCTIRAIESGPPGSSNWTAHLQSQMQANGYSDRLIRLEPGLADSRPFENLMEEVLPFLFGEHLTEFCSQCSHRDGEEYWDVVAYNSSGSSFWTAIRLQHQASQVLFELKNVGRLEKSAVQQLVGYLGDPFLHFGVIVTRNAASVGAARAARQALRNHSYVVIILNDDDILEMLRWRGEGRDPTECLRRIYLDLVRQG